jgi:GNAT superfamily N-acetyltransferase
MRSEQLQEIEFRTASGSDVPAMARSRQADPDAHSADSRMEAYFNRTHHPQGALRPRIGLVATAGDEVIGYIAGHLTRRFDCDGEVQYLFVAPPYRRMGVARRLLELLADWFSAEGATRICVDVNEESPAARSFYVSMGATVLRPHWMVWDDIGEVTGGIG